MIRLLMALGLITNQGPDTLGLKNKLLQFVQNSAVCSCQLSESKTDGSGVLNMVRLREGCAITDPVLVEEGMSVAEGLFVDKVEMVNLEPTGNPNEWRGRWRISFKNVKDGALVAPVEAIQFFYVDPHSAAIESCKPRVPAGAMSACPPGMIRVGTSGQFGAYCIDQSERAAKKYLEAKYECGTFRPAGFGPSRLCEREQWASACGQNLDPSFTGNGEWIADHDPEAAVLLGSADCTSTSRDFVTELHPFRCCLR